MKQWPKVLRYSFKDLLRSKWTLIYTAFFLLSTVAILYFSSNLSKAVVSLMNIVLTIVPLMSTMIAVFYYYHSREFVELLLAQPVRRSAVLMGQYLGLSLSLALGFTVGTGLPFLLYGIHLAPQAGSFVSLLAVGIFLSFIFVGIAFLATLKNDDRIKGFGLAILVWLFMAVIYDGIFLLVMVLFKAYPLEKAALWMSMCNPIDLSRIFVMLQLDTAAMLGYTGAVFRQFFGTSMGQIVALTVLFSWVAIPMIWLRRMLRKKDF